MSKERKFHQWIERQNRAEKKRVWEKICEREKAEMVTEQETESIPPKVLPFLWKKWSAIAAAVLVVCAVSIFSIINLFPFGKTPDNGERYFTVEAYEIVETDKTLEKYASEIQKNILFFDWYEETDHLKDCIWQLKDGKEIICFQEEVVDVNTGCLIYIFLTPSDVKLDAFNEDEKTKHNIDINGVMVNWSMWGDKIVLNFEHENYRYYLRIIEPIDENYILDLVEELLS